MLWRRLLGGRALLRWPLLGRSLLRGWLGTFGGRGPLLNRGLLSRTVLG